MTSDGTMITNCAAATAYWGMGGMDYTKRYQMTYNVTTQVYVSCPVVIVQKTVAPTTIAIAQTATYTICVVNASLQASAWNVTMTDRLSDWMGYAVGIATWAPAGSTWYWTHSGNSTTWAATNAEPPNGQATPWYMRWMITPLGPGRSACVTFKGTVL
jgi:uncharacterized repeat protein (TIGR01451 family)